MKFNRAEFDLEVNYARRHATGDFALERATDGELAYLLQVADLWRQSGYNGIRAIGSALVVTIDAEVARREFAWNLEQSKFDAIAAGARPDPLPTGDMDDIPGWSEVSAPDGFPEIAEPEI